MNEPKKPTPMAWQAAPEHIAPQCASDHIAPQCEQAGVPDRDDQENADGNRS